MYAFLLAFDGGQVGKTQREVRERVQIVGEMMQVAVDVGERE